MFGSWVLLIATVLLLGVVALRWPRGTVMLLGVAVALEVVSQWYPDLGGGQEGALLLSPARLAGMAVIAAALGKLIRDIWGRRGSWERVQVPSRLGMIFFSPLMAVVLGFLLYGAVGVFYSADGRATVMELLRLGMLAAVLAAAAYVLEKEDIPRVLQAVHMTGLVLAPLACLEKMTGWLLWQGEHLILPEEALRVNATFVDPNIYARYLVLAVAANLVLQRVCTTRRQRVFYWMGLAVLLLQLVLTQSRGGVVALGVVLVLALICLPRRKEVAGLLGGVTVGAVALVALRPQLWERITEIGYIFTGAESQRLYLIKVALAMFGDHPVVGTGLGTFQAVFMEQYAHYKTMAAGAWRSHTAVLTLAAEQGVIGLVFLGALCGVLVYMVRKLYRDSGVKSRGSIYWSGTSRFVDVEAANRESALLGAGCLLWVAAIFVSAQAEGRFFEDPMLWVAMAMLMVLHRERLMTG